MTQCGIFFPWSHGSPELNQLSSAGGGNVLSLFGW